MQLLRFNSQIQQVQKRNPFNPPTSSHRLPYWINFTFTQGEPDLVNEPIDTSPTINSLLLPETLSLPPTPSVPSKTSLNYFPICFPYRPNKIYQELQSTCEVIRSTTCLLSPLSQPEITVEFLPPPFICTELNCKYDRYTKKQ